MVGRRFCDRKLPCATEGDLGFEPFEHAGPFLRSTFIFSHSHFGHLGLICQFDALTVIFSRDGPITG